METMFTYSDTTPNILTSLLCIIVIIIIIVVVVIFIIIITFYYIQVILDQHQCLH